MIWSTLQTRVQTVSRLLLVIVLVVIFVFDVEAAGAAKTGDADDFALAVDEHGKTGVPVNPADTEAGRGLVEATLLSQLRQAYRELCADCRVEFKDVRFPPFAAEDAADLKVNFKDIKWGGSFLLPVEFLGAPQSYLSGQVRLQRQGLQAARSLNALTALSASDVKTDWIDVTFLKDQPATLADLDGAVAKKFLTLRQTILKSDLRLPQIVSRGQMIKVTTGTDTFEIISQMRAEDSASLGEYVKVKTDQNKILSVRVIAPGTARLE
jgi:flagella basal body P-ring formation protein FlgA